MNTTPAQSDSKQTIQHVLSTLSKYRTLWIAPAVVAMVLTSIYVVALRPQTWSAKQSLIVRDDLLGQSFKPGRFDSIESMKSAQETILEIARKPQVIRKTLEQLGPESSGMFAMGARNWPSEETIESVQGSIAFNAPNGAEFGKTEVIVLNTKASSRDRSRKFIELLLTEIIVKVDEVRSLRLQSMESELTQAYDAAKLALDESKLKLQEMYENLGSDFGSMSSLSDTQSSGNTIKRDISQIKLDKRETESELEKQKIALAQLIEAKENPQRILSISGDLIALLPVLDSYKNALIKTQGELAVIKGQYEPAHPSYRKAITSIEAMKQQMYLELEPGIEGLQNQITLTSNKLQRLELEMGGLDDRLVNLGSKRVNNLTLEADLRKKTETANNLQQDLAEIQGLSHSRNAELITRVDDPQVSTRPDGLGKKSTVLAAGFAGLMLGLGLVMLIAPPIGYEQQHAAAGRNASNSDSAPGETIESIFDAKSLEKIIVSATTAATTAIQSANKARQFFMSPKSEHEDKVENDRPPTPADKRRTTVETPAMTPVANANTDLVTSPDLVTAQTVVPRSMPQQVHQDPPETPSVDDLVEAANVIANPAPVASQPLSSLREKLKLRQSESKLAIPEFSVRPVSSPAVPAQETTAVESTIKSTSDRSISQATAKPPAELAAIQLAALRGTRIQAPENDPATPSDTVSNLPQPSEAKRSKAFPMTVEPTTAKPAEAKSMEASSKDAKSIEAKSIEAKSIEAKSIEAKSIEAKSIEAKSLETEIKSNAAPTSSEWPDPDSLPPREDPQTIVLSELPGRNSTQLETDDLFDEPVARLTRRGPNVRPVDLAKSAAEEESTFVRINPSNDKLNVDESDAKDESGVFEKPANVDAAAERSTNPFLKNRSPKPTTEQQIVDEPADVSSMDVPDQIQKLSDSIAKFANPANYEDHGE